MNVITVREPQALDRLRNLGAREPIHLFTDPAVTLEPLPDDESRAVLSSEGVEPDGPLVAICPHFFSTDHPYRVHHYERFSRETVDRYHQALAQAADWLANRGRVLFVPLNTESPDDDRETICEARRLMSHGNKCFAVERQLGPREITGILKLCDLVLATRLHAAVCATSVLTPTVAISYGPKVEGYMARIGQEKLVAHFESLEASQLIDILADCWRSRISVQQDLAIQMTKMRELAVLNSEMAALMRANAPR